MLGIAAILAGLFLGFRDLIPYVSALRSGIIVRKGVSGVRVHRAEDPAGFDRLLANRSKGAAIGFGVFALGVIVSGLFWLSLVGFSGPLAFVLLTFYVGIGGLAAYFLIRGFSTGQMFAFYGLSFFGDARRRGNPTWFWAYAGFNVLVVLNAVLVLVQAFHR